MLHADPGRRRRGSLGSKLGHSWKVVEERSMHYGPLEGDRSVPGRDASGRYDHNNLLR